MRTLGDLIRENEQARELLASVEGCCAPEEGFTPEELRILSTRLELTRMMFGDDCATHAEELLVRSIDGMGDERVRKDGGG